MDDKEFNRLMARTPELAPRYKEYREAGEITLEEASALSGLDIETLRKVEGGEYCLGDDLVAYHRFFLEHVPNAIDIFYDCEEGVAAKFDYMDIETGEEVIGAELVYDAEDEEETEGLQMGIPELGPQFKLWREESNITLEQASELSGMDIETLQMVENGEVCTREAITDYHKFFFNHIPDAPNLYESFMNDFLADLGYTYDEEGNEYKDGVRTTDLDEE